MVLENTAPLVDSELLGPKYPLETPVQKVCRHALLCNDCCFISCPSGMYLYQLVHVNQAHSLTFVCGGTSTFTTQWEQLSCMRDESSRTMPPNDCISFGTKTVTRKK